MDLQTGRAGRKNARRDGGEKVGLPILKPELPVHCTEAPRTAKDVICE
jgi:hypothetical protein